MGMFDYVRVEKGIQCKCGKLHYDFQTKDLENTLSTYLIKKNRFYEEITSTRAPKEEEKHYLDKEKKIYLPCFVIEHGGWRLSNYFGTLYFYSYCDKGYSIDVKLRIDVGQIIKKEIEINEGN